MRQEKPMILRLVSPADWTSFRDLESEVWGPEKISTASRETFDRWLSTHPEGFIGAFDTDSTMIGYHYGEIIAFDPDMIGSEKWLAIARAGYRHSVHDPGGNALYGISISSKKGSGAGDLVLRHALEAARACGKRYYVGICRIAGFRDFLAACGHTPSDANREETRTLGQYYARERVAIVGGKLGPSMMHIKTPPGNPRIRDNRKDIVGWFAERGMTLYDVVYYPAISDPGSCDHGAIIVADLVSLTTPSSNPKNPDFS